MKRILLLLIIFNYCNLGVKGQLALPKAVIYTHFTPENCNINSDMIYSIVEDRWGYIWLGTDRGLLRYNGYDFEPVNINYQERILKIRQVNYRGTDILLMIALNGRILCLDTKTQQIINTDSLLGLNDINNDGKPFAEVFINKDTFLFIKKQNVDSLHHVPFMVRSINGRASLIHDSSEVQHLIRSFIFRNEQQTEAGSIYKECLTNFSTINFEHDTLLIDNKLYRSGAALSNTKAIYDAANLAGVDKVISGSITRGKELWIGFRNKGIICYTNFSEKGIYSETTHYLSEYSIASMYQDSRHNVWVSTYGHGVFLFSNKDLSVLHYDKQNSGLFSDDIDMFKKIGPDKFILFNQSNNTFSLVDGKKSIDAYCPEFPQGLFTCDHYCYILTNNGIMKADMSKPNFIRRFRPINLEAHAPFLWKDINEDQKKVYCLSSSGILFILDTQGNVLEQKLKNNAVTSVQPIADQDYLIGTNLGLYRNEQQINFLRKAHFYFVRQIDQTLYLGTSEGIYSIPLSLIDSNGKGLKLLDSSVSFNVMAERAHLYFLTEEGLLILERGTQKMISKRSFKNYTIPFSIFYMSIDSTYIGVSGYKGIFFFPKKELLNNDETKPRMYILNSMNGFQPSDTAYEQQYNNKLSFFFKLSIIDFNKEQKKIKYQILKDGVVLFDWASIAPEVPVRLNKPEPGKYTIRFLVYGGANHWEKTIEYSLVVLPRVWQTCWFKLLCLIITIMLTIYIINRIIIYTNQNKLKLIRNKLRGKELEAKTLAAQLNPHFMFNALTPLQDYTIRKDTMVALNYINKFASMMRSILNNCRLKSVSLEEDLGFIKNYIDIQQIRFDNSFDFEIKIDPDIDIQRAEIPTLFIQPLIENAIEHGVRQISERGWIRLSIILKDQTLIIEITDNGPGFKQTNLVSNHALQITEERLSLIKQIEGVGALSICNNENGGACVRLSLPYKIKKTS